MLVLNACIYFNCIHVHIDMPIIKKNHLRCHRWSVSADSSGLFGFNQGIFYDKNQKGRTPGKFSLDVRSCSNLATQSLDIQLYIHFLAQMLLLKLQFVDYTMLYPDVSSILICYLHFPHLLAEDEVPKDHILQQSG